MWNFVCSLPDDIKKNTDEFVPAIRQIQTRSEFRDMTQKQNKMYFTCDENHLMTKINQQQTKNYFPNVECCSHFKFVVARIFIVEKIKKKHLLNVC